jgi:hypothetical protein
MIESFGVRKSRSYYSDNKSEEEKFCDAVLVNTRKINCLLNLQNDKTKYSNLRTYLKNVIPPKKPSADVETQRIKKDILDLLKSLSQVIDAKIPSDDFYLKKSEKEIFASVKKEFKDFNNTQELNSDTLERFLNIPIKMHNAIYGLKLCGLIPKFLLVDGQNIFNVIENTQFDKCIQGYIQDYSKDVKEEIAKMADCYFSNNEQDIWKTHDQILAAYGWPDYHDSYVSNEAEIQGLIRHINYLKNLYIFLKQSINPFILKIHSAIASLKFIDRSNNDFLTKKLVEKIQIFLQGQVIAILNFSQTMPYYDWYLLIDDFKETTLFLLENEVDTILSVIKKLQFHGEPANIEEAIFYQSDVYIEKLIVDFLDSNFKCDDNPDKQSKRFLEFDHNIVAARKFAENVIKQISETPRFFDDKNNGIYHLMDEFGKKFTWDKSKNGEIKGGVEQIILAIHISIDALVKDMQNGFNRDFYTNLPNFFAKNLKEKTYDTAANEINKIFTNVKKFQEFLTYWNSEDNHFYELLNKPGIEKFALYDPIGMEYLKTLEKKLIDLITAQTKDSFNNFSDFLSNIKIFIDDFVDNVDTYIDRHERISKELDEKFFLSDGLSNDKKSNSENFIDTQVKEIIILKDELKKSYDACLDFLSTDDDYDLEKIKNVLSLNVSAYEMLPSQFKIYKKDINAECQNAKDYLIYLQNCQDYFNTGADYIKSSIREKLSENLKETELKLSAKLEAIDVCGKKIDECAGEISTKFSHWERIAFDRFKQGSCVILNPYTFRIQKDQESLRLFLSILDQKSSFELLQIKNELKAMNGVISSAKDPYNCEEETTKILTCIDQYKDLIGLNGDMYGKLLTIPLLDKKNSEYYEKLIPLQWTFSEVGTIDFGSTQSDVLERLRKRINDLQQEALSQPFSNFKDTCKSYIKGLNEDMSHIVSIIDETINEANKALPSIQFCISALAEMNKTEKDFRSKWLNSNNLNAKIEKNSLFDLCSVLNAEFIELIKSDNYSCMSIKDFADHCKKCTNNFTLLTKTLNELNNMYLDLEATFKNLLYDSAHLNTESIELQDDNFSNSVSVELNLELSNIGRTLKDLITQELCFELEAKKDNKILLIPEFNSSFASVKKRYDCIQKYCHEKLKLAHENSSSSNANLITEIIRRRSDSTYPANICVVKILKILQKELDEKARPITENQKKIILELQNRIKLERDLYEYALVDKYNSDLSKDKVIGDYIISIYEITKETLTEKILRNMNREPNLPLWLSQIFDKILHILELMIERFDKLFKIEIPKEVPYCGFFATERAKNLSTIRLTIDKDSIFAHARELELSKATINRPS